MCYICEAERLRGIWIPEDLREGEEKLKEHVQEHVDYFSGNKIAMMVENEFQGLIEKDPNSYTYKVDPKVFEQLISDTGRYEKLLGVSGLTDIAKTEPKPPKKETVYEEVDEWDLLPDWDGK